MSTLPEHTPARVSAPYRAAEPERRPAPVPYDPQLERGLAFFLDLVERVPLRAHTILENRAHFATVIPTIEAQVEGRDVVWEHRAIPGPSGAPDVEVTIDPARFRSRSRNTPFGGRVLRGAVAATIVGGRLVYLNDAVAGTAALAAAFTAPEETR